MIVISPQGTDHLDISSSSGSVWCTAACVWPGVGQQGRRRRASSWNGNPTQVERPIDRSNRVRSARNPAITLSNGLVVLASSRAAVAVYLDVYEDVLESTPNDGV